MKTKLFMTTLMLVSIFFTGFAYEKASNKYAKAAKHIMLVAHGFDSKNASDYDDEIVISIIDFQTNKWLMTIVFDEDDAVTYTFSLINAIKTNFTLSFYGTGLNNQTGEEMELWIDLTDIDTFIRFKDPEIGKKANMIYDSFSVSKDKPNTHILFHDLRSNFDLNDTNWKEGTTKQLRMCLSENPFLIKI